MFAAAIDPLLLADLDMIQPPRSLAESIRLGEKGTRGDLENYLRSVLIQWVMSDRPTGSIVRETVRTISVWDRRLGVWCAAACAEAVLRFVPAGENRPRLAVEAAKKWVFGVKGSAADYYADAADAAAASAAAANDVVADPSYAKVYPAFYAAAYAAAYAASAAASDAASSYAVSDSASEEIADAAASYAASAPFVASVSDAISYAGAVVDVSVIRYVIARAIETFPVD